VDGETGEILEALQDDEIVAIHNVGDSTNLESLVNFMVWSSRHLVKMNIKSW
jgi:hypothetical protein